MPTNECIPLFEDADRITVQVTDQKVFGKRFVSPTTNPISGPGIPSAPQVGASDPVDGGNLMVGCVPGAKPLGVSTWDGEEGQKIGCITEGIVPITAGENLPVNTVVGAGEGGKAVKLAVEGSDAFLETGSVANKNLIVWRAVKAGTAGATVKIKINVAGANTAFKIVVAGELITVTLATNASSEATTTAQEVIEKVNANAEANALVHLSGGEGSLLTGVVAALAETLLAGGKVATERGGLVVIGATSGNDAYVKLHC